MSAFRENLANSYREVAIQEHQAGHSEIGAAQFAESLDILEKLIRSEPEQARYHAALGRTWNAMGYIHDEMRNNAEGDPRVRRRPSRNKKTPSTGRRMIMSTKVFLCNHLENLGEQYLDLGSVAGGLALLRSGARDPPEAQWRPP